jgi:prepilin-type N-terminal cleavage/methylation domain-containing protein
MSMRRANPALSRGVTLIELLIGLAVGAIVLLAVIAAWGLSVRSAAYTMESARLNNDLRSTMQILSQDLRRADGGLDVPSERAVRFSNAGDCVTYYVEGEPRGYRLSQGGDFQIFAPADPTDIPDCSVVADVNGAGLQVWFGLYDQLAEGQFSITEFTAAWEAVCYPFDETLAPVFFDSATHGTGLYPRCDGMTQVTEVLEVTLTLTGEIGAGASGTKRMTVQDTITVRNNDVQGPAP